MARFAAQTLPCGNVRWAICHSHAVSRQFLFVIFLYVFGDSKASSAVRNIEKIKRIPFSDSSALQFFSILLLIFTFARVIRLVEQAAAAFSSTLFLSSITNWIGRLWLKIWYFCGKILWKTWVDCRIIWPAKFLSEIERLERHYFFAPEG